MHDDIQPWHVRGATKAIAERLGISEAAVSQWRRNGVPMKHRQAVREVIAELLPQKSEPGAA